MIETAILSLLLLGSSPQQLQQIIAPNSQEQLKVMDQELEMWSMRTDDPSTKEAILAARRVIYDILYNPSMSATIDDIQRAITSVTKIIHKL